MGDRLNERSDAAKIRAYYDQTWSDYRMFWLNPTNRAIHFGYWDEHTRTHDESLVKMNRVMAERIKLQPGERLLDAGCGFVPKFNTAICAARVTSGAHLNADCGLKESSPRADRPQDNVKFFDSAQAVCYNYSRVETRERVALVFIISDDR